MHEHLSEEAVEFIKQINKQNVPEGETKRTLVKSTEQHVAPPLLALMRFIAKYHSADDEEISKALLERVNPNNGFINGITEAVMQEGGAEQRLRLALEYRDSSFFDLLQTTMEHIVRERRKMLKDDPIGAALDKTNEAPDSALPPVSDVVLTEEEERIRREAQDFDAQRGHLLSQTTYRRISEASYPTYEAPAEKLDRFHRQELGKAHVESHQREAAVLEAEKYLQLAQDVCKAYDATVGHSIPVRHR